MSGYIERPRYQCALGGALATLNSVDRAVAIVHSAPGCSSSADSAANVGSGYWGATYCGGRATPSTNILEKEIIFGGESRLKEQIESTFSIIDGDLFAVITGCMTDIIGDDVKSITETFRQQGKNIVVAETGGFKGNSSTGYDLILEAIFTQFTEKGLEKNPRLVNILGLVPSQDVFWRGNLIELRRLLIELGIEVNTFFTPFDNTNSLKTASSAALNIVLSNVHGINAAKAFKETHGTDYISLPFPIGPSATNEFLKEVGKSLGICSNKVDEVIEKEKAWYYSYIHSLTDIYNDLDLQRNAIVIGDANYGYSITRFVSDDLGWIPAYVAITDILEDDQKELIKKQFDSFSHDLRPKLIFEENTSRISKHINEDLSSIESEFDHAISPAFVLGSTLDRPLAAELKAGFWSVSYPIVNRVVTDQGYVGYRGGLRLATEIFSVILGNR
ncbi:MAG TPA: nitrogenase component 1 [Pseudobacteroides sp.]|uniref:nitrogenase component 1 n=1 Tax=Pseudobacteroides sp. TaxID=1968840 RepID=UPI002F92B1B8